MKLVVATPLFPPEIGGPATYAKLLHDELPKKGVQVEVVKFSDVRHLPRIIRHLAYYRLVCRAARSADAVLALDPVSVGAPALFAARKTGRPFLVKIVGDYAWEQGRQRFGITATLDEFVQTTDAPRAVRVLRAIQARVARSATHVIVPSEYLKRIVETWDVPAEKISVVYNTVSLAEAGTAPQAIRSMPRPLVVTAGRLVPWKHIEGIIDVVGSMPHVSLAIAGDGPLRSELERRAELRIPNRAVFLGTIAHADMLAVMRVADVFVLNSSYEGFSHLLVEAVTLGVPVVATRVGGNSEIIHDGENGLLVPFGDSDALQNAIRRVLDDSELRARLEQGALASAERFSIETMLAGTLKALQSI